MFSIWCISQLFSLKPSLWSFIDNHTINWIIQYYNIGASICELVCLILLESCDHYLCFVFVVTCYCFLKFQFLVAHKRFKMLLIFLCRHSLQSCLTRLILYKIIVLNWKTKMHTQMLLKYSLNDSLVVRSVNIVISLASTTQKNKIALY